MMSSNASYVDWETYDRHFPLVPLDEVASAKCLLLEIRLQYNGSSKSIMVVKPEDGRIPLKRLFHRFNKRGMPDLFNTPNQAIAAVLNTEYYVWK